MPSVGENAIVISHEVRSYNLAIAAAIVLTACGSAAATSANQSASTDLHRSGPAAITPVMAGVSEPTERIVTQVGPGTATRHVTQGVTGSTIIATAPLPAAQVEHPAAGAPPSCQPGRDLACLGP